MKKLVVACLAILVIDVANAQTKPKEEEIVVAKTKLAIKGGANMSTARVYQNDQKLDSKFVPGYGIGLLFKIPFEGHLYFSPNLAYNRRGYTYTPKAGSITEYQNTIHYFDIVPNLSVILPAGKNSFVVSGGPHLSVAIAGTEKQTIAGNTSSSNMKFSLSGNYGFIDLGVGGSLGFHMDKFLIEAGFQMGLANINNNVENDFRNIQNRMFSLQVGYFLK
jgi:Outer membrane protein beta-barrel domain